MAQAACLLGELKALAVPQNRVRCHNCKSVRTSAPLPPSSFRGVPLSGYADSNGASVSMEAVRTRRGKEDRFVPVTADDKIPVLEKTITERSARGSAKTMSPLRYTSEEQRISASDLFAEEIQVRLEHESDPISKGSSVSLSDIYKTCGKSVDWRSTFGQVVSALQSCDRFCTCRFLYARLISACPLVVLVVSAVYGTVWWLAYACDGAKLNGRGSRTLGYSSTYALSFQEHVIMVVRST